jgi:hypothetical protein
MELSDTIRLFNLSLKDVEPHLRNLQCRDVVSVSNVSVSRRLGKNGQRLGLGTKRLGLVSVSFSNVS